MANISMFVGAEQTVSLIGSCDATQPPVISILTETEISVTGSVETCSGVESLVLGALSDNVNLNIVSGAPGDLLWTFELILVDPRLPGTAQLVANDSAMVSVERIISLVGIDLLPIPVLSPFGLWLLTFLVGAAGCWWLRRRIA